MYTYQLTNRYFAQIADGMEDLGAEELHELNARNIKTAYRGIYFEADIGTLYRINYLSRLVSRILAPLKIFKCHSTRYLYRTALSIEWTDFFTVEKTFAVFATTSNSTISHSQYAALCLKDAIADWFRERCGSRPSVDTINPDVWINLHIENNRAVISLDTSGGSLHRRGYRTVSVEAPIQETLAAAIIRLSDWDGTQPLYDPMCGSGTLLAEALLRYCRIPSGIFRKHFGFELLPDFEKTVWESVREEAGRLVRPLPKGLIAGSDSDREAIKAASANIRSLPGGEHVSLQMTDFNRISALEHSVIVCNPPYGIRSGRDEDIAALYGAFGAFLKQHFKDSTAYIYFGNRNLVRHVGLRPAWKKALKNGGLDGRLARFDLY